MAYAKIPNHPGTYALVFRCDIPFAASPGRLGAFVFPAGFWIYVGSACGPGGLRARLTRHLKPSPRRHWHLDYIKEALQPVEIWTTIHETDREHAWANWLASLSGASRPIAGFGSSDCSCRSHLIHWPHRPNLDPFEKRLRRAMHISGPGFEAVCHALDSHVS